MSLIERFFPAKAAITSAMIRDEIARSEREINALRTKLGSALGGVAAMSDSEHVKIQSEIAVIERAITRLEARVAYLNTELPAVIAAEDAAAKTATDDVLRKRAAAATKSTADESKKLLERYGSLAKQMAEIFTRLAEIDVETSEVNELLRYNPVVPTVSNYAQLHRKAPDREASATKESRPVWTFSDGQSERALISADGSVRQHDPHWGFQEQKFLVGTLVRQDTVVSETHFRRGAYLEGFSAIQLPPAFWGDDDYYWPRKS